MAVAKLGFDISGSPRTVAIYHHSGGGTFDASKLIGEWVKDDDSSKTLTFYNLKPTVSDPGIIAYIDFWGTGFSGRVAHTYAGVRSNGVIGYVDTFKAAFEGDKLRITEPKGDYIGIGVEGLYIKLP
jgi:hypothetical protein